MSSEAELREQLARVRVCSLSVAGCALEPRFLGPRVCDIKLGVTELFVWSRSPMKQARKVEGQCGFARLSQVGHDAGGPGALAQGGDRTVSCALPVTSVGVFSDMLSRCKKDGPVPKAQPRDVSDFSLYAPETKPCCSSPYKLQGPRALAFSTWPFWSTLIAAAFSLSHDCQTAKCPRSLPGL